MTNLPPDVLSQLRPMPADFAPSIENVRGRPAWRGRVTVATEGRQETIDIAYAAGSGPNAATDLAVGVWVIHELARLGRGDLLAWARKDRHAGVKPSQPQWDKLAPAKA